MRIRFIKDFNGSKTGDTVRVNRVVGREFIRLGVAELVKPDPKAIEQPQDKMVKKTKNKAVQNRSRGGRGEKGKDK